MEQVVNRFSLTKYYMDCETPAGDVILCYASDLHVGGVQLRQSSVLVHSVDAGSWSRQSFFRGRLPRQGKSGWVWHCPALGVRGQWACHGAPSPAIKLYETETGKNVVWQCLAPRADVCLSLRGRHETGTGYVECLSMSLEPWKLPVDTLHWGRYHGLQGTDLTWIFWEGEHPLSLLLRGSECVSPPGCVCAAADGSAIDLGGGSLMELSRDRVLRTGDISNTALKYFPGPVKRLLPGSILHLQETKWAGAALLHDGRAPEPGFAIHEIVRFNQPCP